MTWTHWLCSTNFLSQYHLSVGGRLAGVQEDNITTWLYVPDLWLDHKNYVKSDWQDLLSLQPHCLALVNLHPLVLYKFLSILSFPWLWVSLMSTQSDISFLAMQHGKGLMSHGFGGAVFLGEGVSCSAILSCFQVAVQHVESLFLQIICFASEQLYVFASEQLYVSPEESCRVRFKWVRFFPRMARFIWFSWILQAVRSEASGTGIGGIYDVAGSLDSQY